MKENVNVLLQTYHQSRFFPKTEKKVKFLAQFIATNRRLNLLGSPL